MTAPPPTTAVSAAASSSVSRNPEEVFYPDSDGQPMAENMWQADAIMNAAFDLRAARPEALVAADILMYPERGNPRNSIAPDVLVAFGIGTHKRSSYFVWEEGKPPDLVLEVASPSTARKDLTSKGLTYAAMGVREYWLFDPKGDVFPAGVPRLQGFRLVRGEYRPLPWRIERGVRMIRSEVLDLGVRQEGELLRFWDPLTGRDVPHHSETLAAAVRAEAEANHEASRREAADARAKREAARASREAAARADAEARVAELEAALRRSQTGSGDHGPEVS